MTERLVITDIVPTPKVPGMFDLVVDGAPYAALDLAALDRLSLHVGQSVANLGEAIARAASDCRAYLRGVRMLGARGRSARDLERRLVQTGETAASARAAVERLEREGYLNDAEYARQYTLSKARNAGLGRRRITRELLRQGVSSELADQMAVDVYASEGMSEEAIAIERAVKRLRALTHLDAPRQRQRVYAYLARRGYSPETIRRAMGVAFREHPAEDRDAAR
jgi:regulatory protein